ncbi:type I restriction endonuclease subunit R [Fructilactobacillus sp. Tb1]|uniref:type I restriction endonuclease subunit R n=1 Tax=Fructilactobacillus sp. Tb1 TaxID=3422304 RepID=UPI003D2E74A0
MVTKKKSELKFESDLVDKLTHNGWTHVKELDDASPKQLEEHFREILNQNNREQLHGVELTDNEFAEVMRKISAMTPTEMNNFLTNGYVAEITVSRDNPEEGKINLKVFWRDDIAGGRMRYEVVRQAVRPGKEDDLTSPNRRFDVTLLFNGLPLIQIEEKRIDVNLKQASNQIKKYKSENKYDGLFSSVQLFVVLKENAVRYFANEKSFDMFNDKFFFQWLDNKNTPVRNWEQFTEEFLKIPMAHNIISNYMVVDGEILKVLRPYQIHAVKAVREAAAKHEDGYVWHATGSGKTLTAYKTATLIQRDPHNQVIFMSDRKELDNQSGKNFSEFSTNSDDTIFETNNTRDLIKKLKQEKNGVITTTINKMKIAVDKNNESHEKGKKGPLDKAIDNKRFIFIVDEAHRSQFGDMQRVIRQAFPNQNWYGFTGTPIFDFNKTPQDQTTESQFGPELHRYNIGNALNDHAILDFNAEYVSLVQAQNENDDFESEKMLPDSVYEGDSEEAQKYREKVVNWMYKNWKRKSENGEFNALLATSNIDQALAFYKLFKEKNKDSKRPIKVAITYSLNENGDENAKQRAGLVEAMKDYSLQYSDSESTFNLDNIDIYIDDVAKRTARTEAQYKNLSSDEEIDLTIVVNRLLTGFDAPRLDALYMDKLMQYQGLIQAYARTNRIYSKDKSEGNIIIFRRPKLMEERTKDAFEKYAGEGSFSRVFRPDFEQMQQEFKETVENLKKYVPTPEVADALEGESMDDQIEYLSRFREMAKKLKYISSYSEFNWDEQANYYNINEDDYAHYQGAFENIKNVVTEDDKDDDEKDPIQLRFDFDDVYITNMKIDKEYVLSLATKALKRQDDDVAQKEYQEAMAKYKNSGKTVEAENIKKFVELEKESGQKFDDDYDATARFALHQSQLKQKAIKNFAEEWGLDKDLLSRLVTSYEANGEFTHEKELKMTADKARAEANGHEFKNLLNYKGVIQKEWREFISEDLKGFGDNNG